MSKQKKITYEKNVNAIKKKSFVLQKEKKTSKNKPLFHPFKSTAPYLSSIKVHFSGSDKKWSSPNCSSSSLACGGRMFSTWSMEWDTIQSTREKSGEKWKKWMLQTILYFIHLLISLPYIIQIILNEL